MVKRRNSRPNRKKPSRTRSTVARVATGIPVSKRRENPDPPMLPMVLAFPTRIRFSINQRHSNTVTGYTVYLPTTPTSQGEIDIWYNAILATQPTNAIGLTVDQICHAAAMRVFGVDVTTDTTSANYVTTEYAIQKVVVYGSENRVRPTTGIILACDFSADIPGFVGRDTGGVNRRPVVAVTPPRLTWLTFNGSQNHILSVNVGGVDRHLEPQAPNSLDLLVSVATLDISIIVRRGAVTQVPVAANATLPLDSHSAHACNA